jgi:transposase
MANDTLVAVDLAKSVFEVAISHHSGQVAKQRRYSRRQFPLALAQLPPSIIVMEACGSAHFWARRSLSMGHQPVLLPPHAVRPYVRRNKTDRTASLRMARRTYGSYQHSARAAA